MFGAIFAVIFVLTVIFVFSLLRSGSDRDEAEKNAFAAYLDTLSAPNPFRK